MTTAFFKFGIDYPKRPQLFGFHVIKLLSLPLVARELGANGCNLIRVIAVLEDDQHYRGPVLAVDDDLRPRMAVAQKTLVTARRRCVDRGWLHYEASPGRGEPSRMWVTVPRGFELKSKAPIQGKNYTESGTESVTTLCTSYIPNPIPSPIPLGEEGWKEVKKALEAAGLRCIDQATTGCQKHGLRPSDVLRLVGWWRDNRAGFTRPEGALYAALCKAQPELESGGLVPDLGVYFPPLDPDQLERERAKRRFLADQTAAQNRTFEDERIRTANAQERQLLLDFEAEYGHELNDMSDDAIISLCPNAVVVDSFRKLGRDSPLVRPDLLKAVAAKRGAKQSV